MAERRMFAKTIVLSDAFLDMPMSARCLYFTLSMMADDDGFINNPRSIMRVCGASDDDAKILIAKKFIITFQSGVIVIKHWRINNYLRSDRYSETKYLDEKSELKIQPNGSYTQGESELGIPGGIPVGIPSIGKDRLDKDRLGEDSNIPTKHKHGTYNHVLLSDDEFQKLSDRFGTEIDDRIQRLDNYIEETGKKYKNHYLTITRWADKDEARRNPF